MTTGSPHRRPLTQWMFWILRNQVTVPNILLRARTQSHLYKTFNNKQSNISEKISKKSALTVLDNVRKQSFPFSEIRIEVDENCIYIHAPHTTSPRIFIIRLFAIETAEVDLFFNTKPKDSAMALFFSLMISLPFSFIRAVSVCVADVCASQGYVSCLTQGTFVIFWLQLSI